MHFLFGTFSPSYSCTKRMVRREDYLDCILDYKSSENFLNRPLKSAKTARYNLAGRWWHDSIKLVFKPYHAYLKSNASIELLSPNPSLHKCRHHKRLPTIVGSFLMAGLDGMDTPFRAQKYRNSQKQVAILGAGTACWQGFTIWIPCFEQ